jgi:EAL domain-containing protein (putative c-di-GMP-specific phosphodiesterase class I)
VETAEQRDFLAGRGCDFLQGFLLYAPMPASALAAALSHAGVAVGAAAASDTSRRA